jgi:hypothetical protein
VAQETHLQPRQPKEALEELVVHIVAQGSTEVVVEGVLQPLVKQVLQTQQAMAGLVLLAVLADLALLILVAAVVVLMLV